MRQRPALRRLLSGAAHRRSRARACVFAEISGADGVQPVMADTAEGTASTVMPLPLSVQPAGWADVQATA
ncbi:MAG: hypothetical protein ACLUNO_11745 [Oscillospiraceae bacterium]